MAIITLLTDFGSSDEYVGVMKGVIHSIHDAARIIDISHHVAPQQIQKASLMLKAAYSYFPAGTIHVAIVDPGVGSQRHIIAAKIDRHFFVAPDNGLLTDVLSASPPQATIRVSRKEYFLPNVSHTFHGRDIFAPVAAHIAEGLPLNQLGPLIEPQRLTRLEAPLPFRDNNGDLIATILSVDFFGNLTTNITLQVLNQMGGTMPQINLTPLSPATKTAPIKGVQTCYSDVPKQKPLAIMGSKGYLEISVNCGNAAMYYGIREGNQIRIDLGTENE